MRPSWEKASFTRQTPPLQHPPSEVIFYSVIVFLDYHHFFFSLVFWCCVLFPSGLIGKVPRTSKLYFEVALDICVAFLAINTWSHKEQKQQVCEKHWAFVLSLHIFASSVLYVSRTSCTRNRHCMFLECEILASIETWLDAWFMQFLPMKCTLWIWRKSSNCPPAGWALTDKKWL